MKTLTLHIKNMVCPRCETIIRMELEQLGVQILVLRPGYAKVVLPESVTLSTIARRLQHHGFALLKDPDEQLIERVKIATLEYVHHQEQAAVAGTAAPILSDFLSQALGKNYSQLSKLFSGHEGTTLEKYYIRLRIARVKELLDDGELNVSEIARQLGYSSVHYLSAQFKKVTGQSVTHYRNESDTRRHYQ